MDRVDREYSARARNSSSRVRNPYRPRTRSTGAIRRLTSSFYYQLCVHSNREIEISGLRQRINELERDNSERRAGENINFLEEALDRSYQRYSPRSFHRYSF